MCGAVDDALTLSILRSVLIFLVSRKLETNIASDALSERDNINVANVHYRMYEGGMLSALERINCLIELSWEAQHNTLLFNDSVGIDNVPYFLDFISMIPNP